MCIYNIYIEGEGNSTVKRTKQQEEKRTEEWKSQQEKPIQPFAQRHKREINRDTLGTTTSAVLAGIDARGGGKTAPLSDIRILAGLVIPSARPACAIRDLAQIGVPFITFGIFTPAPTFPKRSPGEPKRSTLCLEGLLHPSCPRVLDLP